MYPNGSIIMDDEGDGEGDDDDLWDGWGEESDISVIPLTSDILKDNLKIIEEHSINDDDKEEKEKEVVTGNKRDSNYNSNTLSKNIENENDIKNNLRILRIQQQQRKKDQKSIKLAKQKARQQEKIAERNKNLKSELGECSVREELEDSYDEMTSGKEGEEEGEEDGDGDDDIHSNEEEGEKMEVCRGKSKSKSRGRVVTMSDENEIYQRRVRAQVVLNNIIQDYATTTPTSISTHPLSVSPTLVPSVPKSDIPAINQVESYDDNNDNNNKKKNTITITADDLQCDPRLHDLLGALAASQQCCSKLWTPKKTGENAYTKVSVST